MRTAIVGLFAALASVVYSATIPGLPACAASCVTNFGSCNQLDVKCICSSTNLIADLACCVSKVCDASDQAATLTFANSLCEGQGVSDLPQTATCASTASGSATATSSATSTAAAGNGTTNATITSANATATSTTRTGTATATAASTTSSAGAMATAAVEWLGSAGLGLVVAGMVAAL